MWKMWVVKTNKRKVLPNTLRTTKEGAMNAMVEEGKDWSYWSKKGYVVEKASVTINMDI